jgi:hypothetical protein
LLQSSGMSCPSGSRSCLSPSTWSSSQTPTRFPSTFRWCHLSHSLDSSTSYPCVSSLINSKNAPKRPAFRTPGPYRRR